MDGLVEVWSNLRLLTLYETLVMVCMSVLTDGDGVYVCAD